MDFNEQHNHMNNVRTYWNESVQKELHREISDPKKIVHTDLLWREISRCIGNRKKLQILDAGCGPGRFSLPLAQKEHSVSAFDISRNMIEIVQNRAKEHRITNLETIIHDLSSPLPYKDNQFDLVLCLDSPLSFCPSTYKKNLRELIRVCKDHSRKDHSRWAQYLMKL